MYVSILLSRATVANNGLVEIYFSKGRDYPTRGPDENPFQFNLHAISVRQKMLVPIRFEGSEWNESDLKSKMIF